MKASLVKLITLEQQLAAEKLERQKLENEFTSYKEKQASDIRVNTSFQTENDLLTQIFTNNQYILAIRRAKKAH